MPRRQTTIRLTDSDDITITGEKIGTFDIKV
jgi:hypothetical protein